MNARQINHPRWQKPFSDQKRLLGKVVLVVGYDTAVMHNLVRQLVQKGADIALYCWHLSGETARKMEKVAQIYGRRLLVIEPVEPGNVAPNQVFEAIKTNLGRLDIFIDLSAQKRKLEPLSATNKAEWSSSNWSMTWAFLEASAHQS